MPTLRLPAFDTRITTIVKLTLDEDMTLVLTNTTKTKTVLTRLYMAR